MFNVCYTICDVTKIMMHTYGIFGYYASLYTQKLYLSSYKLQLTLLLFDYFIK